MRSARQSASAPGGKPDLLFQVPSTIGCQQRGIKMQDRDIDIAMNTLGFNHHPVYRNKEMHELLICYVHMLKLKLARDAEAGIDMYVKLIRYLELDNFLV